MVQFRVAFDILKNSKKERTRRMGKKNKILLGAALAVCLLSGCTNEKEENKTAYRELGINYLNEGNYGEAITAFDKALEQCMGDISADEIDITYYKATALYAAGDVDGAVECMSNVIAFDASYADASYMRGCMYLSQGNTEGALADFAVAIKENENDYELYIGIYENLSAYGLTDDAENYINKAFSISGNEAENNLYRGRMYILIGEYENALAELEVAKKDELPEADFYMGKLYEAQGDVVTAESYYQAYLAAGNADAATLCALGNVYLASGNYEKAAEYLVEALGCEEVSNKKGVMEDLIIAYEYAGDFDFAWNVMQEYATSYTLTADLEREYIFLENRQMKEEVEEATEPETEEGTEASDTESEDTESSQTPEGEGTTAE